MSSKTRWILCIGVIAVAVVGVGLLRRGERAPDGVRGGTAQQRIESGENLTAPQGALTRSALAENEGAAPHVDHPPPASSAALVVHVARKIDAAPVAGARVSVLRSDGGMYLTMADEHGVAQVWVAADEALVVIGEADVGLQLGRARVAIEALAAGEVHTLRLELPNATAIGFRGLVLDRDTGEPIADARVAPQTDAEPRSGIRTDLSGRFELPAPTASHRYAEPELARVEADGYTPLSVEVTSGHEREETALRIFMGHCAKLRATLVAPADRYEGVVLTASVFELAGFGSTTPLDETELRWEAAFDANLTASFDCLEPRIPLTAHLARADGSLQRVGDVLVLAPKEERSLEWDLGGVIRGRVVDQDGAPVTQVEVWRLAEPDLGSATRPRVLGAGEKTRVVAATTTDVHGAFELASVSSGAWWVGVRPEGLGEEREAEAEVSSNAVLVHVEGSVHECEVRVWRDLVMRGRVRTPDGEPSRDTWVTAELLEGRGFLDTVTDEAGHFTLGRLSPGPYVLQAWGSGSFARSDTVQVEAGNVDVELVLKRAGTITGRVLGVPPDIGQLSYSRGPSGDPEGLSTIGDVWVRSDGSFALDNVDPGRHDLTFEAPGGLIGIAKGIVVEPGVDPLPVTITLAAGAMLRIRYEGVESFATFRVYSDGGLVAGHGFQAGTVFIQTVPAGTVRVVVCDRAGRFAEASVDVEPGATEGVVLRLE